MAGKPLIQEVKNDFVVSPGKQIVERFIAFMNCGFGDLDVEKEEETRDAADTNSEWETLSDKYK